MPFILACGDNADDFLDTVAGNLSKSGPSINYNRTAIIIRAPFNEETLMTGNTHNIGNRQIAMKDKVKYLETYITRKLNHRKTVEERKNRNTAIHRKTQTRLEYLKLILPIMAYRVKCAATPKLTAQVGKQLQKE